jgi:hypothetical protein
VSAAGLADADVSYALVCLKTGALLELLDGRAADARMQDLAAASPELFRAGRPTELAALFAQLGSQRAIESFQEILFVSERAIYVAQLLTTRPGVALVAASVDAGKLGLILSGVRAHTAQLEAAG